MQKTSSDVFFGCGNLANVSVTENYIDSSFCGKSISKDGTCSVQPGSSSKASSSVGISSVQQSSTKQSSEPNLVISGTELSAKPINWFVKGLTYLVPAAILSFLL